MSPTATPQHIPSEQIFGTAKRICLELEKLTLSENSAVVTMLHTMCVHRENKQKMDLQARAEAFQAEQTRLSDAAMADARRAHAQAAVQRENQLASQIASQAEAPKLPRLSIVLDKPGNPSAEDLDAVEAERQTAGATAPAEEAVAQ